MESIMKQLACLVSAVFFAVAANAEPLPADEDLADLYSYSCKACHAVPASGAPQTGDANAWKPRLQKGMDSLLDNTIDGFKGMPALGSCPDCSAEDFIALIEFMSSAD